MNKHNKKNIVCPVEITLNIIGKKWTVLIIRDLLSGKKRFGELLRSLSGVSPRTLSLRLSELEKCRVIKKKVYPVVPLKVEYSLDRRGRELKLILEQMRKWGLKHKK